MHIPEGGANKMQSQLSFAQSKKRTQSNELGKSKDALAVARKTKVPKTAEVPYVCMCLRVHVYMHVCIHSLVFKCVHCTDINFRCRFVCSKTQAMNTHRMHPTEAHIHTLSRADSAPPEYTSKKRAIKSMYHYHTSLPLYVTTSQF
jgi:hypothetical protein